jgi:long-subunit acyl-CoA synthetase (AMP-forming)
MPGGNQAPPSTVAWTRTISAPLLALRIRPEDRVAIAAITRLEWILADSASSARPAPPPRSTRPRPGPDVAFILRDSGSRIVFAEDDEQLAKLRAHRAELLDLLRVVTFDGTPDGTESSASPNWSGSEATTSRPSPRRSTRPSRRSDRRAWPR